ncbi:MAG: AAA family ATPase, partial [Anaerolineales bacterium]
IALLAYLTVTRQPQSRDTLAALLWPDLPQTNARAALRRTISALHRTMDEPFLESQQDLLALPESGGLRVDLWDFRGCQEKCENHDHPVSQVCRECLPWFTQAADLYTDTFMAGFTLRDSTEFDDWQFFQSETLRRELGGILERLVNGFAAQAEFTSAINYAQRWLSLDSLHEPVHRQLMLLYAVSGQRTAALRQYQECAHILDEELGVAPLEETRQLFEDIKNNREIEEPASWSCVAIPVSPHPHSLQAKPVHEAGTAELPAEQTLTSLPLTGRDAEWVRLQNCYSSIHKDGRLVVLEGEAGIGKTRLASEFIASLRSAGAGVVSATCYPGEASLALAPFAEGLSHNLDQPGSLWYESLSPVWLGEAARLLPVLSRLRADIPHTPYSESPGAQTRFFEGLRQAIHAACGMQPPGVLFLDDIQWADETSLELLSYIVQRLSGTPLLVLLTWRSEDLGAGHRLRRMLAEAQRSGHGELIQLSRLASDSIEKLVASASLAKVNIAPTLGQRIYEESEGLPYFVVEYLASLTIAEPADAPKDHQMPHGVRDLLYSRLEQIGETAWQLLQAAAVIGRSFDFEILRGTGGRTDEETITTLESLIQRGLIAEVHSENGESLRYDFSHDKLRELVYSETSQARKRLLHTRAAEALVGRARRQRSLPVPAGQAAHHFRQGGMVSQAAEYYKLAGEQARALYANREALTHFQNALALGHPEIAALDEAIGDMQTLIGNYNAAIQSYQAAMAQQIRNPTETARLDHKLGEVFHRMGEWEQAERYFQACAETLDTGKPTGALSHLYADWSRTLYQYGDANRASQMAERALALAEQCGERSALAQSLNVLGILARRQGHLPDAIHYLERSLSLAVEMAEPTAHIAALNNLSLAYADQGDRPRAIQCARQALDLCMRVGDRHHEAALRNNLADLYHASGQEAEAMAHLKQAVVIFREIGSESIAGTPSDL